jgi:Mn-dependent DtxR family transcriptional regulator
LAIHESGEDYLETIYLLSGQMDRVRSIDVAAHLGVTRPSVSRAMSILRDAGYLKTALDGSLTLTESGFKKARLVYERHEVLTAFLEGLGVSRNTAAQDACRMEHVISEESFHKLRAHAQEYIDRNKRKE